MARLGDHVDGQRPLTRIDYSLVEASLDLGARPLKTFFQVRQQMLDIAPDLYAFHRYTWNSTPLYKTLACQFRMQFPG